MSKDSA